jgi:hypothetical protein
LIARAIADKVKSGKLEIVLNQFAPTRTGFYLCYPQRSRFSQSFSHCQRAPETTVGAVVRSVPFAP